MNREIRLPAALFVALVMQVWPWTQLTRDGGALRLVAVVIGLVLAIGWCGRLLRLPLIALAAIQVSALFLVALAGLTWAHGTRHLSRLPQVVVEGIAHVQNSSAPMHPHAGVTLLLLILVGLLAFMADWLAVTGERPAWGILPLVTMHLVLAFGLATPTQFSEFVLLAAGIVLVLVAGSPLRPREGWGSRAVAMLTAAVVGVTGVGLSWAIAPLIPPFEPRQPAEPLQMSDPSLDLKRNLIQASDEVVITYSTDRPDGVYLKLATLPAFSAGGFALSDVRVATGRMPGPPGDPPGDPRTTRVQIGGFRSEWLPVPTVPTGFDAPGEWGFALDTLDVMALAGPGRGAATENISYEVTSLDVRPERAAVAAAASTGGTERDLTLGLPSGVPQRIRDLAVEITEDAPTAGAKAQAIEAFLLSDRFTYSTAPTTGTGDGLATIDDFLFRSRRGYCEQFAGAMAIMAREVGIPSRMAVGFMPGEQIAGAWQVTARDLHTWPELWLDGLGWVAFEPTPGRGTTGEQPGPSPSSSVSPTPGATATASATPSAPEDILPPATPSAEPQPQGPVQSASVPGWSWALLAAALVAILAGGFAMPRLVKARRRTRRLAGTGDGRLDTLAAWDEVRDTASDLGLSWPEGSPRYAAERFADRLGEDDQALADLRRLAAAAERALFDRPESFTGADDWGVAVRGIAAAMERRAQQKARPRRALR